MKKFLLPLLLAATGCIATAQPANDNIINAELISGSAFTIEGDNTGSTIEYDYYDLGTVTVYASETISSFWGGGNSIWYRWIAPYSGEATLDIVSQFTPILDVFQVTAPSGVGDLPLNPLAYNQISFVNDLSGTATFTAVGGLVYYFRIASFTAEQNNGIGTFALTLTLSNNLTVSNNFATATPIYGASVSFSGSNTLASAEVGEPAHAKHPASHSVWITWTAPSHGSVTLSTTDSTFDTVLAVYTGSSLTSLTSIAANDNISFFDNTNSKVTFIAEAGQQYYFAVDGVDSGVGDFTLNLEFTAKPPTIKTKPANQIIYNGDTATFSLTAVGTGALSYQWQRLIPGTNIWEDLSNGLVVNAGRNDVGVIYGGALSSSLTVNTPFNTALPSNGDQFRCVVSDITGATYSTTAVLTLTLIPQVNVTVQGPLAANIDLTNGIPPPPGTTYYIKGLPAGFTFVPETGQIIPPGIVTAKPGDYLVTYGTITVSGSTKVTSPPLTLLIKISPLSSALSGKFEALVEDTLTNVPNGKVELAIDPNSAKFTGRLTYENDSKVFSFAGTMAINAQADISLTSVVIARGNNLLPYRIDLQVDATTPESPKLLVSLKQLDSLNQVTSTLGGSDSGVQMANYSKKNPLTWGNTFTMALSDPAVPLVNNGLQPAPEGTGFGTLTVSANDGYVTYKGVLGDGTVITSSMATAVDNSYRWYSRPYKAGGSFTGTFAFSPVQGNQPPYQVNGAADSTFFWKKSPNIKDKAYRAGFGPLALAANARGWVNAKPNGTPYYTILGLNNSQGSVNVQLTSTSLTLADSAVLPTSIRLDYESTVINPPSNLAKFNLKGTAKGIMNGGFTLVDGRKVTINGVYLDNPTPVSGTVVGEGYFTIPPANKTGEAVTGRIRLTAP